MDTKLLNQKKIIIIAEACDNHFGSLRNAKQMATKAKQAGNGSQLFKK